MHDFRRLRVWHQSRELGSAIYILCSKRPRADLLITAQLRRSALSIATNVAEGCGKNSRAETIRYLEIASGSAAETEHHLEVALEVGILTAEESTEFVARTKLVRQMLRALILRLPR